ncbi:MAG TPA: hypothetical protein VN688_00400 [Gemmataceae bacterium]|nr:hypothetical protein [Gemmataceae bacterium]
MTTETLTCPYCNASINVQPGLTTGQRITCPRCGDTFPLRHLDAIVGQSRPVPPETRITADAPSIEPPRRSPWLVGGAIVGMMLLMAGGGLAFMLMTQDQRRAHDTSRPPRRPGRQPGIIEPDNPAIASVPPDKLAALGYLPPKVNFLVGAHITELLASPVGKQILSEPISLGRSAYRLERLPAWVGLRLEDIDHLVLAAQVDDNLLPTFYLVLRTTQPYEEEQLRDRLKGERVVSAGKKKLYAFHPQRDGIKLHVWFADERTFVLALLPQQLESLPAQPVEDLRQLSGEIRTVLKERREPMSPAWVVGHSRDWTKTSVVNYLSGLKKKDLERLSTLRTFGIWLVPDKSLTVKGVFECKDEAAARGWDDYFHTLRREDASLKTALEGSWLVLQYQTEPDFLSRFLKK